jgi:oligoribonuclease NrnB/cAMP/cGMP phosphodiesterase (DHH superfamily)
MVLSVYPDATVEHHDYNTIDERFKELTTSLPTDHSELICADVLPNDKALVEALLEKGEEVDYPISIYDHHQDREYLNEWEGCRHDLDACGTLLVAEEFDVPDHFLEFAAVIDLYDRWQDEEEGFDHAFALNDLFSFIGLEKFIDRGPESDFDDAEEYIVSCIEDKRERDTEKALKEPKLYKDEEGRTYVLLIDTPHATANRIMEELVDEIDYQVVWRPAGNSVSLSSPKGGMNVADLAASLGGGGHEHASGYTPNVDLSQLIATNILKA